MLRIFILKRKDFGTTRCKYIQSLRNGLLYDFIFFVLYKVVIMDKWLIYNEKSGFVKGA